MTHHSPGVRAGKMIMMDLPIYRGRSVPSDRYTLFTGCNDPAAKNSLGLGLPGPTVGL